MSAQPQRLVSALVAMGVLEPLRSVIALGMSYAPDVDPLALASDREAARISGADQNANELASTLVAALVLAACGVRVAKHGNRSVTSKCGSADLLEGLGVAIELSPQAVARCVNEVGIGFMYAVFQYEAVGHPLRIHGVVTGRQALALSNPQMET